MAAKRLKTFAGSALISAIHVLPNVQNTRQNIAKNALINANNAQKNAEECKFKSLRLA